MDTTSSSDRPPDGNGLIFDLELCKTAPLVCHTPFECDWNMRFGFTAENKFYTTNELSGFSSEWIHDDGQLRLQRHFSSANDDSFTIGFKYDSMQRFNLNIRNSFDSDTFDVTVLFVTKHSPLFWYKVRNVETQRDEKGRYAGDETIPEWDDLINASAFGMIYQIEKTQFYSWMKKLFDRLPCTVTFDEMIIEPYLRPLKKPILDLIISKLPSKSQYFIECIKALGTVGHFLLDYYIFKKDDITMLKCRAKLNLWNEIDNYFRSLFVFLKKDISLLALNFDQNDYAEKQNIDGHVTIKLILITPTKILKDIVEDNADNRALRRLGADKFLQVKFRDEDGTWFPREPTLLESKMHNRLIDGLVVAGKSYFEFGSSSSLFRESGTYMFEAESREEIVQIINEWAVFKHEPAAKVAARVGLFFSSATEIHFKLRNHEVGHLRDFVTPAPRYSDDPPQYTFSDGIGIIDVAFARKIQDQLGLHYLPTAFQFRCLGCKGMVAIDPTNPHLVSNGGQYVVMFRDSQRKFETRGEMEIDFDMIKYSSPAPLKLHRNFIALLIALARDQGRLAALEKRLHDLFTAAFVEIIESLFDAKAFSKALHGLPKHFPTDKFHREDLLQQDFLRTLIEAKAINVAKLLNSKCQIPLPDDLGRSMLGVIDETGLLPPNTVYIQYSNDIRSKSPNQAKTVLRGLVGVTKSPMYHVGDIRFLEAVDLYELRHYVDVIVFSRRGHRPVPDQIGGGDLDGDCYSVFWDPELLLRHSAPSHFPSPDSSHLGKVTIRDLHRAHACFRRAYMELNNLEQISNILTSHIVLHHPNNPEVETLAEKADAAVNTFKSGLFPLPITPQEKPVYFPAFMNKRHEPAFNSDHVLNQIHERCKRIYLLLQLTHHEKCKSRLSKEKKNVETSDFSKGMYEKYCNELKQLMANYNVKTEAELFAGVTLDPLGSFNKFKINKNEEETSSLIQESLRTIVRKYRTIILDRFCNSNWRNEMLDNNESLSSYTIPNNRITNEVFTLAKEFKALSDNDATFLSFPYLIMEGLNLGLEKNVDRSVTFEIKKNIHDYKNNSSMYSSLTQERSMELESKLIQMAFSPVVSTYNEPYLYEKIISYPSFVISVPEYYSADFSLNVSILKDVSGCASIAVRRRKAKRNFHHYTIECEGTLQCCIQLENMLTPYLTYNGYATFGEMKKRKTDAMQQLLQALFGFPPPPPTSHNRNGRTIMPRRQRAPQNRRTEFQQRNVTDGLRGENMNRRRNESTWRY